MLHSKNAVRDELEDDVFSSADLSVSMPKYSIPDREHDPRHAYRVVADELLLDGNSRQNLATFCQTWLEPEVHRLMDLAIDKNMTDKDEYPQTAELEARSVHILADLWNSRHAANTLGTSTTGSSEAAMLGGMALLWKWRARQKAAGKASDRAPSTLAGATWRSRSTTSTLPRRHGPRRAHHGRPDEFRRLHPRLAHRLGLGPRREHH